MQFQLASVVEATYRVQMSTSEHDFLIALAKKPADVNLLTGFARHLRSIRQDHRADLIEELIDLNLPRYGGTPVNGEGWRKTTAEARVRDLQPAASRDWLDSLGLPATAKLEFTLGVPTGLADTAASFATYIDTLHTRCPTITAVTITRLTDLQPALADLLDYPGFRHIQSLTLAGNTDSLSRDQYVALANASQLTSVKHLAVPNPTLLYSILRRPRPTSSLPALETLNGAPTRLLAPETTPLRRS